MASAVPPAGSGERSEVRDQRAARSLWATIAWVVTAVSAILLAFLLYKAVGDQAGGRLPLFNDSDDSSAEVRTFLIGWIHRITRGLCVVGLAHAALSLGAKYFVKARQDRLLALEPLAPSPEMLREAAYEPDPDLGLALIQWGARAVLLLGLLGTVWGLSLSVKPIADSVSSTSRSPADSASVEGQAGAGQAAALTTDLDKVLANTGEALGGLQTAFSTTLWGVFCSFGLLLLTLLCDHARGLANDALALSVLDSEEVRKMAGQTSAAREEETQLRRLKGARAFHNATKQFAAATGEIAAHQERHAEALTRFETVLDTVDQRLAAALRPGAEQLEGVASNLRTIATQWTEAAEKFDRRVGGTAEALEAAAGTLESASQAAAAQHTEALASYREELGKVAPAWESALGQIDEAVRGLPAGFGAAVVPAQQELANLGARLAETLSQIDGVVQRLPGEFGTALAPVSHEVSDLTSRLEEALSQIDGVVQKLPEAIREQILPTMDGWVASQSEQQQRQLAALEQSFEAFQQFVYWADQATDQREQRQSEVYQQVQGAMERLAEQLTKTDGSTREVRELSAQIVGALGVLQEKTSDTAKELDEWSKREQERQERMLDAVDHSLRAFRHFAELPDHVGPLEAGLERLDELVKTVSQTQHDTSSTSQEVARVASALPELQDRNLSLAARLDTLTDLPATLQSLTQQLGELHRVVAELRGQIAQIPRHEGLVDAVGQLAGKVEAMPTGGGLLGNLFSKPRSASRPDDDPSNHYPPGDRR